VVLALAFAAAPGAAVQTPGESVIRAAEQHPCATATTRCKGQIRVPLDWSDPDSSEITVAFVWLPRADTARPATGTILANFGGPTAALPTVRRFQQLLGPVLERQNLLVVDPRGLGESDPLLCPGLNLEDGTTISACAEALGPRVQYFTTDHIVADMDAVRRALGVPKVSLYGNSYGTVVAHAYAVRFPERTASIYFDSMVHIDEDGYIREPIRRDTDHVELACSRSPACAALPASPTATLEQLVEKLRADPDTGVPIGALPTLLQGANALGVREFPAAATAYLAGDPAPLRRLTSGFGSYGAMEDADPEMAGVLAILCGDSRFPFDRDATPEERGRQLDEFFTMERPLAPFEVGDLVGSTGWAEPCIHWPISRESPPVPAGATYPRVPVLAAAGDFDIRSPAEVAPLVARFPESTLLQVRFGTHALAAGRHRQGQCVRDVMRAFLEAPRHPAPAPAEPGCDAERFRAVGTFPRTVAQLPAAAVGNLAAHDRQLIAAVFATAADAVARRNPHDALAPIRPRGQDGLRGGMVRWNASAGTITLDEVRFVEDLAVTGTIRVDPEYYVTAEIRAVQYDGRTHELILRWRAFVAEDSTEVEGSMDGSPFTALVPIH
jgi:pimeloyl-ACP methyl ester carboxylesterase